MTINAHTQIEQRYQPNSKVNDGDNARARLTLRGIDMRERKIQRLLVVFSWERSKRSRALSQT